MGYDNLNGAFLLLWDRFGFDARLNLAVNKVLDKLANIFSGKLLALVEGKLLVLYSFLNGKGRKFVGFEIKVTCVSAKCFGVNGGKANFAFVFLR